MKPRSGENPPVINSSRSQSCRAVRSHEGHCLECAFSSATRCGSAIRSINSPPWGGMRWLVETVKCAASWIVPTVLSITFIVFDWIISRPYRVVAKIDCRYRERGKPEDYLTEYHFSAVEESRMVLVYTHHRCSNWETFRVRYGTT